MSDMNRLKRDFAEEAARTEAIIKLAAQTNALAQAAVWCSRRLMAEILAARAISDASSCKSIGITRSTSPVRRRRAGRAPS